MRRLHDAKSPLRRSHSAKLLTHIMSNHSTKPQKLHPVLKAYSRALHLQRPRLLEQ